MVDLLPEHTESPREGTKLVRGIYLLPNLFTTAALFAGFYAIVQSMSGHFDRAALAIFAAGLLDGLDGRVARLVNAQSSFGKEYDSLSDVVSFGMAPALMVYVWALNNLGGVGQAAAFSYLICIALRLARYNSLNDKEGHLHFSGLASPAGAVLLSSLTWVGTGLPALSETIIGQWLIVFLTLLIASLTVLNIPYRSFKEVDFRGRVPFVYIFAVAFIFITIAINPPTMLLLFSSMYALSGPLTMLGQNRSFWRLVSAVSIARGYGEMPRATPSAGRRTSRKKTRRSGTSADPATNVHRLDTVTNLDKNSPRGGQTKGQ